MQNTNPVPDHPEQVRRLNEKIAEDALIRVLPYASITKELSGTERSDITAISKETVFAFTDDGGGIQTAGQMLEAMLEAAKQNKAIVAHCEDNSILYDGVVHKGHVSERLDLPGIYNACESV